MRKRITLVGAGKMGKRIEELVPQHTPSMEIVGKIDSKTQPHMINTFIACGDVVIDFSTHTATTNILNLCVKHQKPLIVGTTGHTDAEKEVIVECSSHIPIVWSSNFSPGVNTLFWLTRKAAEILGPNFDLEVVEMHHRRKKDAPSGTAKKLAEILAQVRDLHLKEIVHYGRYGIVGERSASEIGIHSIRGGDVVGDHTVIFAGDGERVELTHKASNRDIFAKGALRAAQWVIGHELSNLYSMSDVLGLPS